MYHKIFKLHADALKAISNEKRLEIINLLRNQSLSVTQMVIMLDLPQANLSQHLSVLKKNSILESKRKGKEIFYHISHPNFIKASDLIREVLIDRCKNDHLAKQMKKNIDVFLPLAHDPVCGMRISPKFASFVHIHNKNTYFFCASGCLDLFTKNPRKFVNKEKKSPHVNH